MSKISINQESLQERREWKRHVINDGSNIYRILPPFGSVEVHNGYPYRKWSYIWLADPATGKRKPFASPFSYGGDRCPAKEYADALAKKVETISNQLKAKGLTDEQLKENPRLKKIKSIQWKLKLSHGYLYNATDKSGTVGLLELKKTAHEELCKRMQKYIKDYGQDPTSLNSFDDDSGIWFEFLREGAGMQTKYSVNNHQATIKHPELGLIKKDDRDPLSDNIVENYETLGYDLHSLYTEKSYDELKDILYANIHALATNSENPIPDLIVEGWGENDMAVSAIEETISEPETRTAPAPRQKPPVTLKLDLPEEEAVIANVSSSSSNDEFFAMADDILKD